MGDLSHITPDADGAPAASAAGFHGDTDGDHIFPHFPMPYLHLQRFAGLAALTLAAAACSPLEVEPIKVAVISVPTDDLGGGVYTTSPAAFFIQGTGIRLSSTVVGQEGCVTQPITSPGPQNFDYIEAGDAITARFTGPTATLARQAVSDRILYELADEPLEFTPGQMISFTIPGALRGFPERVITARTAEAFVADPITLPTSTSEDLVVTWDPGVEGTGAAMFYSIRYSSSGATSLDTQIACVFRDDGSAIVPATLLTAFRDASIRQAIAQRARVTAQRVGDAVTHVTSTFEVTVTLNDVP